MNVFGNKLDANLRVLSRSSAGKTSNYSACVVKPRNRPLLTIHCNSSFKNGDTNGPDKDERIPHPLLNAISSPERNNIGADYGEGFLQFRLSGEKTRLDVDTLNEELRSHGANRIRHTMCPDEAFGLIFSWEEVIIDTRTLQHAAWKAVAEAEGLPFPSIQRPHMYSMRPERAAMDVLHWTRDMKRAQELAWLVANAYGTQLSTIERPYNGVKEWLSLMHKTHVPCTLVTAMDRATAIELLEKLDIRHYFTALVTADDDMDTLAHRYLSAAIKMGRPPNQCVVFSGTPHGIAAAHNCTMRSIALIGTHTAPELRTADLTIGEMNELTVYNLRRLFANSGSEHMDLKKERIGKGPNKRQYRNATKEDDEDDGF